jgi:phosphopantothenoylcysteine decarboxylase/phosphopantothenate--cysteine ligase
MTKTKEIVLGVTGSVAIYKACDLVRRLQDKGFGVTVVMTAEAARFISPMLFQSLSGRKVYTGMFDEPAEWDIQHVSLAEKADCVLIAPATANIIAKVAAGICDDLLTCVVCATTAPVVICPAMNENMYRNRIVRENCKKLAGLGVTFVEPSRGKLACGKIGVGCLADVDIIVKAAQKIAAT